MVTFFFEQLKSTEMMNFSYVIGDKETGLAVVIDPPLDSRVVLDLLGKNNLKLAYIINTHGHYDHTGGNGTLKKLTGAKIVAHESSEVRKDKAVKDGDIIKLDGVKIRVIYTPGHSKDGISLLVNDGIVMTGDTLFVGECGRADLPDSDPSALYESLFNKLMKLDDNVEVYPGHDYGVKPRSTIGHERKHNYTLRPRSREEFVEFMAQP
jgi:glyoxylase-like metal-dependent hydrolase (beta-lactamase superfamily II)